MSSLGQALEDHLRLRRRLGFKLNTDQQLLESFVEFMQRAGAELITSELAVKWAMLPQDVHPHRWGQRLTIVRVFARYMATLDPDNEIPSVDLLPARRPRGGAIHLRARGDHRADAGRRGAVAAVAGR